MLVCNATEAAANKIYRLHLCFQQGIYRKHPKRKRDQSTGSREKKAQPAKSVFVNTSTISLNHSGPHTNR